MGRQNKMLTSKSLVTKTEVFGNRGSNQLYLRYILQIMVHNSLNQKLCIHIGQVKCTRRDNLIYTMES